MKSFYVTTPIYYPNAEPHIGHAYTTIVADVIARWMKLEGFDVFFLTGTDEHGLKLQRAAESKGFSPKEFVDLMSGKFKEAWAKLNIEYSRFIRTTDSDHEELVKKVMKELWDKGLIYRGSYSGWYCTSCERFYDEGEYVKERGRKLCPIHLRELEWFEEETYFLKFSKLTDYVLGVLKEGDVVFPRVYVREVISKLESQGLKDLSITRPKSRVSWGVEAPWDPNHTIYVWIDALLNYLTGVKYYEDRGFFRRFWENTHHVVGKDILWFHTAIWFSLLKMIGVDPPKKVIVHGFILTKGRKMGKSTGNVVTIDDMLREFSADVIRYYLMKIATLDKDAELSLDNMKEVYNSELADTLGNLVRRLGVLAIKKLGGEVPKSDVDVEVKEVAERSLNEARREMKSFRFSTATVKIFDLFRFLNAYMNKTEPWRKERPTYELYNSIEALRYGTSMLWPLMPVTAERIAGTFGFNIVEFGNLKFGSTEKFIVTEAPILFRKKN